MQYKNQFSVDGKDGQIVVYRRNRRRGHGPSWSVSLYSSVRKSDGRFLIFNGAVDKKSLSILKLAISTDSDVAYNWLVRIAMDKMGAKAFRGWLASGPGKMFGSGYMESCTKYTPLVIVRGGLPS